MLKSQNQSFRNRFSFEKLYLFKPKEFDFAARFLMYDLDQKLSSYKH